MEITKLALEKLELSPRELAVTYIDEQSSFVSESLVYRLLKAHDLITSPAYILMQARDKFQHPTTRVNEMWQTDFIYFKITGWGLALLIDSAVMHYALQDLTRSQSNINRHY